MNASGDGQPVFFYSVL